MTSETTPALDERDLELRDWIIAEGERRGNAVISVPSDETGAGYCFTACAWQLHGIPEAVVVGLPEQLGVTVLDAYVDRAATGQNFEFGGLYDDFFDGTSLTFEQVARGHYLEYFGSAFLIYPDGDFPAVQIIVPTPEGHWPWQAEAPDGFREWQPVLTESGFPESWRAGINGP